MLLEFNDLDFVFERVDFYALPILEHQITIFTFELDFTGLGAGDGLQSLFLRSNKNMRAFEV